LTTNDQTSCAIDPASCKRCAQTVPWLSLWGNLSLAIYKVIVGVLGRSQALIADALHSFADVIGSTGILVATKISARHPNENFNYGLGKAEFIGAAFVYTLLLFFAGGIAFSAIRSMLSETLEAPHFVTVLGAVVSVLYNYIMYTYATCVGKRNKSPAILADAFENRADAISSVACIGGILGALYIHPICDPIAALVVGIVIFWNCQEQLREAAHGLMDSGLHPQDNAEIRNIVLGHVGVFSIAYLKSRRTGARYWVDIGIEVADYLQVGQADEIANAVRNSLRGHHDCHYVQVSVLPASPRPASAAEPATNSVA
jgi:cation diffusion facilitator family transporter